MVMLPQQVNDVFAWEAVSTVSHLSLRNKLRESEKGDKRAVWSPLGEKSRLRREKQECGKEKKCAKDKGFSEGVFGTCKNGRRLQERKR